MRESSINTALVVLPIGTGKTRIIIDDLFVMKKDVYNFKGLILVAVKFRKEVTSTVLCLLNFNLRIKCIKVTPYQRGEELFLDVEQSISVKDIEDYIIKIDEKTNAENNRRQNWGIDIV